jgi:hypothetical protein
MEVTQELTSLSEFESWISSSGEHCAVLEPPELANRVRKHALGIAAKYQAQAVSGQRRSENIFFGL